MDYGRGGNDGVLLCRSGKYIRTAHWSASPHHSPFSVAGVCANLLLSYQRNSVGVVSGGNGGDEGGRGGF